MKKSMLLCLMILFASVLSGCSEKKDEVLIISCLDDTRNGYIQELFSKKFPESDIQIQYLSSGNAAAKLKAEGLDTDCDIILALETSYLQQNAATLANHSDYPTEKFVEQSLPKDQTYLPWERYSGCIAIREDILKEKGLPIPTSYDDLLKPEYKGLISMPNPKASGTGYFFLLNMVNTRGEDKAFEYFEGLSKNILHYTSSGSGPVNDLIQGEVAIGLGMTFQSVGEINKGVDITVHYFKEGAPYSFSGFAMIKGKEANPAVKEVFDYLYTDVVQKDKELFSPEQIFKEHVNTFPNYPQDIPYADMDWSNAIETKNKLLGKWGY